MADNGERNVRRRTLRSTFLDLFSSRPHSWGWNEGDAVDRAPGAEENDVIQPSQTSEPAPEGLLAAARVVQPEQTSRPAPDEPPATEREILSGEIPSTPRTPRRRQRGQGELPQIARRTPQTPQRPQLAPREGPQTAARTPRTPQRQQLGPGGWPPSAPSAARTPRTPGRRRHEPSSEELQISTRISRPSSGLELTPEIQPADVGQLPVNRPLVPGPASLLGPPPIQRFGNPNILQTPLMNQGPQAGPFATPENVGTRVDVGRAPLLHGSAMERARERPRGRPPRLPGAMEPTTVALQLLRPRDVAQAEGALEPETHRRRLNTPPVLPQIMPQNTAPGRFRTPELPGGGNRPRADQERARIFLDRRQLLFRPGPDGQEPGLVQWTGRDHQSHPQQEGDEHQGQPGLPPQQQGQLVANPQPRAEQQAQRQQQQQHEHHTQTQPHLQPQPQRQRQPQPPQQQQRQPPPTLGPQPQQRQAPPTPGQQQQQRQAPPTPGQQQQQRQVPPTPGHQQPGTSRKRLHSANKTATPFTMKRIEKDLKELSEHAIPGFHVGARDGLLLQWVLLIEGPEDSPYREGLFLVDVTFPVDYPFAAPSIRFRTRIYHCNVALEGNLNMEVLRSWSPTTEMSEVLRSLRRRFLEPDLRNAQMRSLAFDFVYNHEAYLRKAAEWTRRYAK
mmetsp:Transcript_22876/g.91554  ORF Transcript_22876/g.91554 Transcript_22876/m.91554 type:complete len:674 (+) Transcript_22876:266-2287(+)